MHLPQGVQPATAVDDTMAALQQVTADSIAQLAELLETAMAQAAAVTASNMVRLGCCRCR